MREIVIQQDPTGCAIACTAMAAGVTYREVKQAAEALGIFVGDSRLWSDTAPVRRLLAHYGIRTSGEQTPFTTWGAVPDLALLAIKWHIKHGVPHWHWVVFERQAEGPCVFDPKPSLRQHRRTDFGRMKPKWWLVINTCP